MCKSKNGVVGGPDITYGHIEFEGPDLWDILSTLHSRMFSPVT